MSENLEALVAFAVMIFVFMAHDHFKAERHKREAEEKRRICRNKTDAAVSMLQRMGYSDGSLSVSNDGRTVSRGFGKLIDTPEQLTSYCVILGEDAFGDFKAFMYSDSSSIEISSTITLSNLSDYDVEAMESFRHPAARTNRYGAGLHAFNLYDWQVRHGHLVTVPNPRDVIRKK